MAMRLRWIPMIVTFFCTMPAGSAPVVAQERFTLFSREVISTSPSLQVIGVRDAAQDSCYLIFVIETSRPPVDRLIVQPSDVAAAASLRDHRLTELNHLYETRGFGSLYAGIPANMLPYEFEAQKIQSEFERALRQDEIGRLEEQLERIAAAPAVAVSGPAPCVVSANPRAQRR
jgi:hypothetical protein